VFKKIRSFLFLSVFHGGFIFLLLSSAMIANVAEAADYTIYVDANLNRSIPCIATPDCSTYSSASGKCGGGVEKGYKSLQDVNSFLKSTNSTGAAKIFFKRGNKWVFSNDSDTILISRSNVTIDAYGTGAKPILDGNGKYPSTMSSSKQPVGYAIRVAGGLSGGFSNVYIKNMRIQNMYPGGGIIFSGDSIGNFRGPGSVTDCEIEDIGWAGINLNEVPNTGGTANAILVERNYLNVVNEYPRLSSLGWWPQAINANNSSYGHICRYNVINDVYGEGIGADGFDLVEYNIVSGTKGPAIYCDMQNRSGSIHSSILRYNLSWRNPSRHYSTGGDIRINDEKVSGDNSKVTYQIYGNVVIGGWAGISLKNSPADGTAVSRWGKITVYNNTLIDNDRNFAVSNSDYFSSVSIKNNASIISSDAKSSCMHVVAWDNGSWNAWDVSNNFWYGDSVDEDADLLEAFRGSNKFGKSHPLKKTSGWRALSAIPSFADVYPAAANDLVDQASVKVLSGYSQYLTTGTNWSALPNNLKFVKADQSNSGAGWDFGAIIFKSGNNTQPSFLPVPTDLTIISTK
jgi:hypothetical protein